MFEAFLRRRGCHRAVGPSVKTMFSNWSSTKDIQLIPMWKPMTAALNKNISCQLMLQETSRNQGTPKFSGTLVA